jgi:hypothetical protein
MYLYFILHGFVCRPSVFSMSEDAGIELRIIATLALAVIRCNPTFKSDLFLLMRIFQPYSSPDPANLCNAEW